MTSPATTHDHDTLRELRFWRFATIAVLLVGVGVITLGAGSTRAAPDPVIVQGEIIVWRDGGHTYIAGPEGTIIARQIGVGITRVGTLD